MIKKVLIVLFVMFLMMLSCSCSTKETVSKDDFLGKTKAEEKKVNYLIEENEKNLISIKLPIDYEYNKTQIAFIADSISLKLSEWTGETFELTNSETTIENSSQDYSGYYIDIESKTSYVSDDVISIIFTGLLNKKSAAHPSDILFALNFEPKTMEVVKFSARYSIDEALYNEFAIQAEKQILEECDGKWPEGWGTFSETLCSQEVFLEGIKNGRADASIDWYYTENGIGLSYSVPFALGNHKEVELKRDVLKEITDSGEYFEVSRTAEGNYYYVIYDKNHNIAKTEGPLNKKPHITVVDDNLLKYELQAGTGKATRWGYFYDVEKNVFSPIFTSIYDQKENLVIHGGVCKVVISNMFGDEQYYKEISTFSKPLSRSAAPIVDAKFVENNSVEISYMSGDNYEVVTEKFIIDVKE